MSGYLLIRIGIFSFGLTEPNGFGIATGIVVGGWGIVTIVFAFAVSFKPLMFNIYFVIFMFVNMHIRCIYCF